MAKVSKSAAKAAEVIAAMKAGKAAIKMNSSAMGRASWSVIDADGAVVEAISGRVVDEMWAARPIPIKADPARKGVWIAKAAGEA
jgi:hypothetical protein